MSMIKTKMNLSWEYKLLCYCAQIAINNEIQDQLNNISSNNLDWSYILEESKKQGINCLLYNNLLSLQDKIPLHVWSKIKDIYYLNAYRNTKIYQEIKPILLSFKEAGLKMIPLKGIFLAENAYNNIALRTMNDIDILVKKEDLPKVDQLLNGLGYITPIHKNLLSIAIEKSYLNSVDYFKNDGEFSTSSINTLHLHWHIVNVSLPTYMYTKNIKMDRLWEYARPAKISNVQTLQLAPHHLIIYLAEHALKHSFNRLILLSDINTVIEKYKEKINWDELIKESIEFGMEKQVFYSLYFTNYFLETNIPDYVLSRLRPNEIGFLEKQFFRAILKNNRNTKLCYFVYLSKVKGAINKLKFIFRTFFTPPCVLALYYNLNKSRVTMKDYLSFLRKRLFQ